MARSIRQITGEAILLALLGALAVAAPVAAADEPPYELDPTLSLTGNCSTAYDPVPDPSCAGVPPAYPPPPARPKAQFKHPRAISVDKFGNEYITSYAESFDAEGRIDVFDDEGRFITELAAPNVFSTAVDSVGNLYVFEDDGNIKRYPPSEYEGEEAKIEYGNPAVPVSTGSFVGALAVNASNDHLFVVRSGTITEYGSAVEGNPVVDSFKPLEIGVWTEALAVDAQRDRIYVSYCEEGISKCGVKVVGNEASHPTLKDIRGPSETVKFVAEFGQLGIAVDETTGDIFIADTIVAKTVYQFDEEFLSLSEFKSDLFEDTVSTQIAVSNGERSSAVPCQYPDPKVVEVPSGDACNRHYLFVPVFKSNGYAAAYHPAAQKPPVIEGVSSAGIGETEAEIRAAIFPGGLDTTYHFEITPQANYEAEEWNGATILGEGVISAESLSTEVGTFVSGLIPGGTYRFRALTENDLGKAEEEGQSEAVFATYDDAPVVSPCPNEDLRLGASARLPDCRAYELVSPAETNGRPPRGVGFVGATFTTVQASQEGEAVSFKIEGGALPGFPAVGSLEGDNYVAQRGESGWTTELAGPTGSEAPISIPGSPSPDQGYSFWTARIEGPLVVEGKESEYIRYPDGHSEPVGRGSLGTDPTAQGSFITKDATHIIFGTGMQLEPEAPSSGTRAIYDRTIDPATGAEETHVVSLLPGDVTPASGESAVTRGFSRDGEGIAFEIGDTLYLRTGNKTTYEIGENVEVAGVSEGGERLVYFESGNLRAFDVDAGVINFSTTGDITPVNIASGGTRAAFVSPSVLGGVNSEGDSAQAGEQNLYLSEEGQITFVGTVTDRDVEGGPPPQPGNNHDGLGLWMQVGDQVAKDPSRLNPDGSVFLFQSRANLTGYESGEFPQIYRYNSAADELKCISCPPTKTPATGGASLESYAFETVSPLPFSPKGFVANQTLDGSRAFFESTEALVSTDTDKVQDVYEWNEMGVSRCNRPEGCIYLISSGKSSRDNYLYGHSINGDDVFFTTGDKLTGWDSGEGSTSIYDARVGGGFPEPAGVDECVGDGCRPWVGPVPVPPAVASGAQGHSGNLEAKKSKTCPKGKRKVKQNGKVRCVKKNKKHKGGKAGANRGTGK